MVLAAALVSDLHEIQQELVLMQPEPVLVQPALSLHPQSYLTRHSHKTRFVLIYVFA